MVDEGRAYFRIS